MSLEKLEALELRVRRLLELVQELKQTNVSLEDELTMARQHLLKQEELSQDWEEERSHIKERIEKVLGELESLECQDR